MDGAVDRVTTSREEEGRRRGRGGYREGQGKKGSQQKLHSKKQPKTKEEEAEKLIAGVWA